MAVIIIDNEPKYIWWFTTHWCPEADKKLFYGDKTTSRETDNVPIGDGVNEYDCPGEQVEGDEVEPGEWSGDLYVGHGGQDEDV